MKYSIVIPLCALLLVGCTKKEGKLAPARTFAQVKQLLDSLAESEGLEKFTDEFAKTYGYGSANPTGFHPGNDFYLTIHVEPDSQALILGVMLRSWNNEQLFIESCDIKADTNLFHVTALKVRQDTDEVLGGNVEWYVLGGLFLGSANQYRKALPLPLVKLTLADIVTIANAKEVKIRANGRQGDYTRELSERELEGMKQVLRVFNAL